MTEDVDVHLVLIETAGNQAYIFGTNRLREQIGASEIIRRVGVDFVLDAVVDVTGRDEPPGFKTAQQVLTTAKLSAYLLDTETANPPIEKQTDEKPAVEILVATSGKALLLVKERDIGEEIVRQVTCQALKEAPGVAVCGVVSEPFRFGKAETLHEAVRTVHQTLETTRALLPAPSARFPLLPVTEVCTTSGLPASEEGTVGTDTYLMSPPVKAKTCQLKRARKRLSLLESPGNAVPEVSIRDLEAFDADWLAYIHADGNGLGGIFQNFQNARETARRPDLHKARSYIDDYRKLSLHLDQCTIEAVETAMDRLPPSTVTVEENADADTQGDGNKEKKARAVPLVPVILGGDDLTAVCDGRRAIDFAATFLQEFERLTGEHPDERPGPSTGKPLHPFGDALPAIAKAAPRGPGLSACAGIAVVKPHFPAHRAYELAEALCRSAKKVKVNVGRFCSALDFHVHFDSSGADLGSIRSQRMTDTEAGPHTAGLWAGPYVVVPSRAGTADDEDPVASPGKTDYTPWIRNRLWSGHAGKPGLRDAADALSQGEAAAAAGAGPSSLPRSQQHYLREGLFLGRQAANARLRQIKHRYDQFAWEKLNPESADSLFFDDHDPVGNDPVTRTWLLDAMALAELEEGK